MTDTERLERFFYDLYPRWCEASNRVGAVDELERRGLSISITAWLQGLVRFALLELLKEREGREDADTLLRKVLERTGHTPSLWMEVVEDRISYFAQWQREYGVHGASDYRTIEGTSTSGVLQSILDYEDEADRRDAGSAR